MKLWNGFQLGMGNRVSCLKIISDVVMVLRKKDNVDVLSISIGTFLYKYVFVYER